MHTCIYRIYKNKLRMYKITRNKQFFESFSLYCKVYALSCITKVNLTMDTDISRANQVPHKDQGIKKTARCYSKRKVYFFQENKSIACLYRTTLMCLKS